ncbi:hypothetical protein D3C71_2111570 [compost metagenome]
MHDQAQVLVVLDRGVAEHLADIEHAQAAHFQQVLQHVRAGAVEHVGGDLGEFGCVVGDQPMPARHQFER